MQAMVDGLRKWRKLTDAAADSGLFLFAGGLSIGGDDSVISFHPEFSIGSLDASAQPNQFRVWKQTNGFVSLPARVMGKAGNTAFVS